MMMWQDPSTGTTVPRACRGRATTINDDNIPVEIQTFYIPDPRRAKDPESKDRLARVRPAESLHERLVILLPEVSEPEGELGYQHYVDAQWVTAASRPDLDPANLSQTTAEDAREMASPLTVLGVDGRRPTIAPPTLGRGAGTN
ncbi:MAG: AAA family ATPase, partial [Chthoniobacterales bacterium]